MKLYKRYKICEQWINDLNESCRSSKVLKLCSSKLIKFELLTSVFVNTHVKFWFCWRSRKVHNIIILCQEALLATTFLPRTPIFTVTFPSAKWLLRAHILNMTSPVGKMVFCRDLKKAHGKKNHSFPVVNLKRLIYHLNTMSVLWHYMTLLNNSSTFQLGGRNLGWSAYLNSPRPAIINHCPLIPC
jgi:hypothetical protein